MSTTASPPFPRLALAASALVLLAFGAAAVVTGFAAQAAPAAGPVRPAPAPPAVPQGEGTTAADGVLAGGTSLTGDLLPGIANLDPALLEALHGAAAAASVDGVDIAVTSGWRSTAYQDRLLADAIDDYGSAEEAARWVATSTTSLHVSGDAVDVDLESSIWLADRGAAFGLCRVYDNEPWHFELRDEAASAGCPPTYADPTRDPRLR